MIADADRIRELEEQLGEMRAARDRFDRLARSHEAAHERSKAELAEARSHQHMAGVRADNAERREQARIDERDAAQADAAAWKELHDRHCGVACCEGIEK